MTANAEDTSHLVAMARSGLATHMLRIVPDGDTASGLSGGADERAVLDLIADHLDTPVFRLSHGRYALEAGAETVDALMRAVPQRYPDIEFTVQAFVPPGEKGSDTQTRVMSRIECATEAIQAVLSRLDKPEGVAPDVAPEATDEGLLEALAERDAALFAAIGALDARIAALGESRPGVDFESLLDSRLASMEKALHAHLEARLDGLGDMNDTVADRVQAATGGITRWLQEIDSKLTEDPGDSGAGMDDRLAAMLERQQVQIAALMDTHLAAQTQTFDPDRIAEAAAKRLADMQAETATALADRLDALQHQFAGMVTQGAEPEPTAITDALAVQMANLETRLAAAIENTRPEAWQPLLESLPEQIAAALAEPLADIGRKLAACQQADIRLDDRIGDLGAALATLGSRPDATADAIGAALDPRLDAQSARILTSVAAHLAQQPLLEELQVALRQLGERLDGIEPLLESAPQNSREIADGQTEALTAHIESMMKAAADSLAGHVVGAEDLLQARLEAQHSQLSATLLRHLSDMGDRIENLKGPSPVPDVETICAAQTAETARIAEAVDRLRETMSSLPETAGPTTTTTLPTEHPGALSQSVSSSVAMESMLRRLDAQITRFEAAKLPDFTSAAGIDTALEPLRVTLMSEMIRVAPTATELSPVLEDIRDRLSRLSARGAEGIAMAPLSVAMQTMLRRLDAQICRFEAAPNPMADNLNLDSLTDAVAQLGARFAHDLGALGEDLRAPLSEIQAGLADRPQHSAPDDHGLPGAIETMLRRLDEQIIRIEAATPPALPTTPGDLVARLRETEAQLIARLKQITPGQVDDDALRTMADRLERVLDRAAPDIEGLTRLFPALQSVLRRLDRQVSELEMRGDGGDEIVQDVKMILAEYLAQMDRSLATTEKLRRGA